jgi:UBX domain-containing protein 1/4
MDHLLEHDGEPIPDPSSGVLSSATTGGMTHGAPIRIGDDDEDDDVEALRRLGVGADAGTTDAGGAGEVEAKVCFSISIVVDRE